MSTDIGTIRGGPAGLAGLAGSPPPPLAWAGGVRGAARARGRERWDADILREGAPLNFFPQKNCPDTEKVLKCGGRIRIMGLMEGLVMEITEVSVATVHHVTVVDDGIPGVEYLRRLAADKWEILVGSSWELLPDCSEEEAAFGAWSGGGIAA